MPYPADLAGIFESDVHRRVLGHLSTPKEDYGWESQVLFNRMAPDSATDLKDVAELEAVLKQLDADGLAKSHKGVWRQTKQGFDLLTGPIANEPKPGATPTGPAMIGTHKPQPTPIGKG